MRKKKLEVGSGTTFPGILILIKMKLANAFQLLMYKILLYKLEPWCVRGPPLLDAPPRPGGYGDCRSAKS